LTALRSTLSLRLRFSGEQCAHRAGGAEPYRRPACRTTPIACTGAQEP